MLIISGSLFGQTALEEVNSPYDESHPRVGPDDALYFTRAFHPKNLGKEKDPGDIWLAAPHADGDKWAKPLQVPSLSTEGLDMLLGFDTSGTAFVYHDDGKRIQGIFTYRKTGESWQRIQQLDIPGFENHGNTFSGFLHPEGDLMLLSMESFGALGNEDLYVTEKGENGKWSRPLNLGAAINSPYQELTPFMTQDKQSLFFSSNGHGRVSGTGVFFAKRIDDKNLTSWSTPQPVPGLPEEGKILHYGLHPKGDNAFFSRTISSEGYGNIYLSPYESQIPPEKEELPLAEEEPGHEQIKEEPEPYTPEPMVSAAEESSSIESPSPSPTAVDYLASLKSHFPEAEVSIMDKYGERIENLENYWGPLEDLRAYVLVKGYMPYAIDWEERPESPTLVPAMAGNRLILDQVNFQRGTAEFADKITGEFLELIAYFLSQNPQSLIQVEGHTDSFGSVQLNKELSLKRAAKVRDELVLKGVPFEKIRVTGHGGTRPITSNQTEEGREKNRRVELLILEQ